MISRKNYLQQLIQFKDTDFIKVISGVHRSGKLTAKKLILSP